MNPLFENLKSLSYKDIRLIVEGKPALALEFIRLVKDSGRYQYYEFDGSYCVISLFSDEEHEDMHFYVAANASG